MKKLHNIGWTQREINCNNYGAWVNTRKPKSVRRRAKQNNHPRVKSLVLTAEDRRHAEYFRAVLGISHLGRPGYDDNQFGNYFKRLRASPSRLLNWA